MARNKSMVSILLCSGLLLLFGCRGETPELASEETSPEMVAFCGQSIPDNAVELQCHRSGGTVDAAELLAFPFLQRLRFENLTLTNLKHLRELSALESLTLKSCGLDSVDELVDLTQLRSLDLCGNRIHDLSPLGSLQKLETLLLRDSLPAGKDTELRFLASLRRLQKLDLSDLHIRSDPEHELDIITGLTGLEWLSLRNLSVGRHRKLQTFKGLEKLTALRHLDLGGLGLDDTKALAGLKQLRYLNLESNRLRDLTPLVGLDSLEFLNLASNFVRDLGPLTELHSLQVIILDGNVVGGLEPLYALPRLRQVSLVASLDENQKTAWLEGLIQSSPTLSVEFCGRVLSEDVRELSCSDCDYSWADEGLEPLRSLTRLEQLELDCSHDLVSLDALAGHNKLRVLKSIPQGPSALSDLTPLASFDSLEQLVLPGLPLDNISPLQQHRKLRHLALNDTKLADLRPLAALTELEVLELDHTLVSDLGPLASATRLRVLILGHSKVEQLAPLKGLRSLVELDLSSSAVRDLSSLSALQELNILRLAETAVQDLEPLRHLQQLHTLDLFSTPVSDLSPLLALSRLRKLNIGETQVSTAAIEAFSERRPEVELTTSRRWRH